MTNRTPVIDLHMHSTVSDGTDTPEELLARVKEAGIEFFSVTDHDAICTCESICARLHPGDPRFLSGAEFSCRDESGKYHILGYRYDPAADSIRTLIGTGHGIRIKKLKARLAFLRTEFQMPFSEEDERELFAQPNPGKPHIAGLMVRYGYAKTITEAIRDYLDRLDLKDDYVRPEDAIRSILDAGGIPVLAHPCYGDGDQLIVGSELDARVVRLTKFGLMGLEGFYSGFTAKLRSEVLGLAAQYGLYVTAGSDYHGTNKLVRLADTGLCAGTPLPDGLVRFLYDAFGAAI